MASGQTFNALVLGFGKGKKPSSGAEESEDSPALASASALKSALKDGSPADILDAFEALYQHCKQNAEKSQDEGYTSRSRDQENE